MDVMKKIQKKALDNFNESAVTLAFLGDSVTQGCFEVYKKTEESIETIFDKESAYSTYLNNILSTIFPSVPVNIINAGISGDSALHGLERLERDVLNYNPDLVVVCYGLNDVCGGLDKLETYKNALRNIFIKLKRKKIDVIFMTPNMMNTEISVHITDSLIRGIAENTMTFQTSGLFDLYIAEAVKVCEQMDVKVCDCYKKWKTLAENGVNTTELLANKINHPNRQMNWLFAFMLFETMIS